MSSELQPNIRPADISDSLCLAELASRAFGGYPFSYVFTAEGVQEALERGEARYVVTDEGNQIIGSAVLGANKTKMAEIMRVMIHPSVRKNGAATFLTKELALEAVRLGKYSWADVRADQIGMQRAALSAGLKAISLEAGKHVVYEHQDENGDSLGSARETMIHMTTLPIDELELRRQVMNLKPDIHEQLVSNLYNSLRPAAKIRAISDQILVSAEETKSRIENALFSISQETRSVTRLNNDLILIEVDGTETVIVLPDASAFISKGENLAPTLWLLREIGIQVITYYRNFDNIKSQYNMQKCGFIPSSIRPWFNEEGDRIVWQIAWRKTLNGYESCLHNISLDRIVERQVLKLISVIEKSHQ